MSNQGEHGPLPEAYEGKETGYLKHELLAKYLRKLFLIVGMAADKLGVTELCYIDCFAGPWRDVSEDLSTTSIAVSLEILGECNREFEKRGKAVRIRALYIEKDRDAFARLKGCLAGRSPSSIIAEALQGDFIELRTKVLRWCGDSAFAFFFIDPTGWKPVHVDVLAPLVSRPRSEFLINFMYDFVNRAASMSDFERTVAALIGERPNVNELHGPVREEKILGIYRRNLKQRMGADAKRPARSAYMPVLDPKSDRTKYHLVYLTTHPRGIIEFMEISEDLGPLQARVRAIAKRRDRIERTGQGELFEAEDLPDPGNPVDLEEIEREWLSRLSTAPRRFNEAAFASLIEETDYFPGDLQVALGNLIKTGRVRNIDALHRRRTRFLHCHGAGERLQLS